MEDRYDPQYPYVHPQPPRNGRRGPNLLAWLLIALIVGGLAGGGMAYIVTGRQMAQYGLTRAPAVVNLQTVAKESEVPASDVTAVARVARNAAPSVVEVSTESKVTHPFWGSFITSGAGSGVIVSPEGYIVTNNHVIADSTSIQVRTWEGSTFTARVVGADAQTDLAVLKVETQGLPSIVFADSEAIQVGELAVAIGNPLGTLGGTVTEGVISAKDRAIVVEGETMTLLQTSAAINPGNSGGGLFDGQAHLVGIVSSKSSGSDIEGLGFAIPSNTVQYVVTELIANGYVTGRPSLGVGLHELSSWSDLYRYRLREAGVYVTSVGNNSPFQVWDQLLRIGDVNVASIADVKEVLAGSAVGDALEVVVRRDGRQTTLTVTLQERSEEMALTDMI